MAGFAIFMEVLFWGLIGLITASGLSLFIFLHAKNRISKETPKRRKVIVVSAMAPFLGLLWLIVALFIHIQISNRLAHQDCGFSPDPYVTLPNGYVVGSANTYDGYIVAPGYKTDVPVTGPGYVRSLIDLEFKDGDLVGTLLDFKASIVRRFVFDTRTREVKIFDVDDPINHEFQSSTQRDLDQFGAVQTRVHSDATSYWKLYEQYRHHWPNYVLVILIIAGECAIGFWVWKRWRSVTSIAPSTVLN
jgi:hypothetical protein